nr:MDIS1-interacting receptor like kinase 2-like [Tanacetum cinerariifolium]
MSNANSVSVSINNALVKNSVNDVKSGCLCAICGRCMIAETHYECVHVMLSKMNESKKSKSAKKHKKNVWKPTGHVFTEAGLKWKPTEEIQKPEIKVYNRKPKNVKNIGSSKIAKIVESKNANHSKPNHTWGSNATDIPSSSYLVMRGCPDCTLVFGLQMFQTHNGKLLSAHELLASCSSDEVDALLKWKATLHTQNNNAVLPSWTDDQKTVSPCNWYRVSCNENGSVNRLNLSSSGFYGTLDYLSFSSFPDLMYFELSKNYLSGIIPSEIGRLSKLVYLDLSSNQFTGKIPPEIGQMRNLVTLHLNRNQLISSIPQTICQIRFLSELALNHNSLSGSIPTCFAQLFNLSSIFLNDNNISGSIPYELGTLSNLKEMYMFNNYLSGSIPNTFVNLKKLTDLVLAENQLNGSIPTIIGTLTSLERLELQSNNLSGLIPRSLGELGSLTVLRLYNNKLSGPIPKELGNLMSLSKLQLGENQLNGSMPESFGNLKSLEVLNLRLNQLSGPIPQELAKLKLVTIEISNNSFSGTLPDGICNGGKLERLI